MRLAYADPPYIGQAKKHYNSDEVDHEKLIQQLGEYDGWALSLSSPSLKYVLSLCSDDVRVGAWVKPFCSFKKNVNPAYAWEPVVFKPARKPNNSDTVRDWVSANITTQRGLSGVKPAEFCKWLFYILGLREEDEFCDLFPGSGMVTKTWEYWRVMPEFKPMFH